MTDPVRMRCYFLGALSLSHLRVLVLLCRPTLADIPIYEVAARQAVRQVEKQAVRRAARQVERQAETCSILLYRKNLSQM